MYISKCISASNELETNCNISMLASGSFFLLSRYENFAFRKIFAAKTLEMLLLSRKRLRTEKRLDCSLMITAKRVMEEVMLLTRKVVSMKLVGRMTQTMVLSKALAGPCNVWIPIVSKAQCRQEVYFVISSKLSIACTFTQPSLSDSPTAYQKQAKRWQYIIKYTRTLKMLTDSKTCSFLMLSWILIKTWFSCRTRIMRSSRKSLNIRDHRQASPMVKDKKSNRQRLMSKTSQERMYLGATTEIWRTVKPSLLTWPLKKEATTSMIQ
mmetsp:Transcript_50764/g.91151  ORF Transcript_50764/g.91151 Transcript_50764/m.91151 type:complete len:267 (+) Transcript_50764:564-1364(+)